MKTYLNLWYYLAAYFLELEVLRTDIVQKSEHSFYETSFQKPCRL